MRTLGSSSRWRSLGHSPYTGTRRKRYYPPWTLGGDIGSGGSETAFPVLSGAAIFLCRAAEAVLGCHQGEQETAPERRRRRRRARRQRRHNPSRYERVGGGWAGAAPSPTPYRIIRSRLPPLQTAAPSCHVCPVYPPSVLAMDSLYSQTITGFLHVLPQSKVQHSTIA